MYRAQVRLRGAPHESATFPTRTAAKHWVQKIETDIRERRHFRGMESRRRTVGDLLDIYVDQWLTEKPASMITQKFQLDWWRAEIGETLLCDLRPEHFIKARGKLCNRLTLKKERKPDGTVEVLAVKISPSTVNRYFAALSPVFSVGVKEMGWINENPLLKIKKLKEPRGRTRYLDAAELKRLVDTARHSNNEHIYPFVILALSTGMRKNEILRLKWRDFDADRKQLVLHKTKNGEKRSVPLSSQVFKVLSTLRAGRILQSVQDTRSFADIYIFPSREMYRPVDVRSAWRTIITRAGITDFRIHDLRHTAASYLAMSGASALDIAHILGHKSLDMVRAVEED